MPSDPSEPRTNIQPQIQITPGVTPAAPASPAASVAPRSAGFLSRQHILEATDACFAASGYDGTTIRAIAGRLGCSVGSIYRYFTDKRELLLAVAAASMQPVIDGLRGGDTLVVSQRRYLEQATSHAQLYRLMFWLIWTPGAEALPEPIGLIIDGWGWLLDDRDRARQAWAILHGTLMLGEKITTAPALPAAAVSVPAAPAPTPVVVAKPAAAAANTAAPRFITVTPSPKPAPEVAPLPTIEIVPHTPAEDFTLL